MIDAKALEDRVRGYVAENTRALTCGPVVFAASGGADSTAMVGLMCEAGVVTAATATVAHFDHRLRGEAASDGDRAAVQEMCARFGLRLEQGAWDAPIRGEAAARDARYRFLGEVARRRGARAVVTGHTLDDQVETVIMHTMRGAGTYGLAGMAPDAGWPLGGAESPRLLRPLLAVERAETRTYCAARGLRYVDDASNDDASFLRNRVRRDVMPQLDAMSPKARRNVARLADESRRSIAALEGAVAHVLLAPSGSGVRLSRSALLEVTAALAPYAYRQALVALNGDAREFHRRHYALMAQAAAGTTGSTLHLPRGVVLTIDPDEVLLSIGELHATPIDDGVAWPLPCSGEMGAWSVTIVEAIAASDGASIVAPQGAVVRGRQPGDRIRPRGMHGHKKLQDYYVDRKVPRRERDAAPIIACGSNVLWTPFGAAAEWCEGRRYGIEAHRSGDA
jgi:tRNA(Ile)-lysidine synthase